MPARSLFITGTDTGVGKTWVTLALLRALQQQGQRAAGFKPVASGAELTQAGLRNADALALQAASTFALPYPAINPYVFASPIAPHLAAAQTGVTLDWMVVLQAQQALAAQVDWLLIEGAGGWLLPWNHTHTLGDQVVQAGWPVLLVVGMRLGCLNHALLTAEAIRSRGGTLCGWVANVLSPDLPALEGQLTSLQQRLATPRLAMLGYGQADGAWNLTALEQAVAHQHLPPTQNLAPAGQIC